MYRTIDTATWTDPKVRKLPPLGKLLWIYLITNSHTHVSGIYYLPRPVITHETCIDDTVLDTLFDTLFQMELVKIDREFDVIWVKNMFLYQGRGKKNIIAASHHLMSLHNSLLCKEFATMYREVLKVNNGYRIDRVSKSQPAWGSQEQEQEQYNTVAPHSGRENEFPQELTSDRFKEVWSRWIAHRKEIRHALKHTTAAAQLKKLANWGEERAVAALENSICNGYTGIYEPKAGVNGKAPEPGKTREQINADVRAAREQRERERAAALEGKR